MGAERHAPRRERAAAGYCLVNRQAWLTLPAHVHCWIFPLSLVLQSATSRHLPLPSFVITKVVASAPGLTEKRCAVLPLSVSCCTLAPSAEDADAMSIALPLFTFTSRYQPWPMLETANFCAPVPLHWYCCTCAELAVDAAAMSTHLPLNAEAIV